MVWNFFLGQLILARRVEDGAFPDQVALSSEAVTQFEKVNQLEKKLLKAEGFDGSRHTEYKRLRRWLREKTRIALSEARRRRTDAVEAAKQNEIERVREEDRRQMISFLSHTLTSATVGGSKTVRKIVSKLANAQANVDLPDVAQRLAAQVSRMARVESLVEVFKLYTSDDKALREGWARDTGGEFSVLQVCAMAIQQALLRFYFSSEHEADFSRLMPEADYTTASHEFINDVLALDMSTPDRARQFIDWAGQRLPFLRLSFAGAESAHLSQGGARDIVIFALTGEFLGNALKYAAAGQAITLDISVGTMGLEIVCRNAMNPGSAVPIHSGKTGLTFIRRVCMLINAEFDEPTVKDNVFILRALLPIQ